MKTKIGQTVTQLQVLDAISDDISISLFNLVANNRETSDSLIDKLGISHKQYRKGISKLLVTGLVKRLNRVYVLTSFGKLIYEAQFKVAKAIENLLKLMMKDAIRDSDISQDEYTKFIDELIDENELKDMILSYLGGTVNTQPFK